MTESMLVGSMLIDGGFAGTILAGASSHFCTAERQFRMPVEHGNQRPPSAQWTATASGCCIVGQAAQGPYVTGATAGRIVDLGITDANNMGAAMAPVDVRIAPYPIPLHRKAYEAY